MNNGEDTNPLPTDSVYDTIISYDQFTYSLVFIFWNNTSQLGMTPKSLDTRDDTFSHCSGECCRVLSDILDDLL